MKTINPKTFCRLTWPGFVLTLAVTLLPQAARVSSAQTITVDNLADLHANAGLSNATIKLAPGEYWIEGDGSNPVFLDLAGSNNTYDFSGAEIKLDTRDLGGYGLDNSVIPITVTGNNNLIRGLSLKGVDVDVASDPDTNRFADRGSVYLTVTGNDNTLQDTTLGPRGSTPYGLGDVFGKGGRPETGGLPVEEGGTAWINHRKTSGFLVHQGATNTVVDNLNMSSYSYGHGFVIQTGATNTTIRNSEITGELCPANSIILHPEYQEYAAGADGIHGTEDDGGTRRGTQLYAHTQLSCQEDGIRMYGDTHGLTVENTIVTNMRSGVHSTFGSGPIVIDNVEAYGTENGFVPGSNTTITNSKGDITNGPLVYVQYNGKSNTTIDVELVGDRPVGVDWAVAYLNGDNFDVTINSDLPAGFLPEDSLVRFGQTWFNNWRDELRPTTPEEGDPGPFTNSTFINNTNELTVLGNAATSNTGSSKAPVVTNGKANAYDGVSLIQSGTRIVLTSTMGLGNNGTEADGTLESNASIVELGATLELQPGIQISDEKLTISGDGVDGRGALYSEGTVASNTRFGSSNSSDESTIFLDGDSSIGVGVAGNQLNVGGIQGQGDLIKIGPGILTIGKPSNYSGDLFVNEGHVVARPGVVQSGLTVAAGASIAGIGNNAFLTTEAVQLDGTLDLNGRTDDNALVASIGPLAGAGRVIASNPVPTGASQLTIDTPAGSISLFTGEIEGNVDLVKSGAGLQFLAGTNSQTGMTLVEEGGLLVFDADAIGAYTVADGGVLGAHGTIDNTVTVQSGGTFSPGISVGTLSVSSVDLQAGSTIAFTLSSEGHSSLSADSLMLGGDLSVTLQDTGGSPFTPMSSDTFTIATAAALTGAFDTTVSGDRVTTLDGRGSFVVTYNEALDAIMLNDFLPTGFLPGDFNGDGVVESADYTILRDSWGQNGLTPFSGADANGDGTVDSHDYHVWRDNFGRASATSAAAVVPEPLSLFLGLGLLPLCIGRPRSNRCHERTHLPLSSFLGRPA